MVAPGTKGIQIHNQVAVGRTGESESLTKVAEGKRGWDALGRLGFGFPPREQVGLPHGDLVWELRRGLSPNQVAS